MYKNLIFSYCCCVFLRRLSCFRLLNIFCCFAFLLCYALINDQPWLAVWSCTMWEKMPPLCSNCAGDPCSATAPSLSTTILSALETVRIRWAIMRTVLSLISRDSASWMAVSFSTSKLAVASSSRMMPEIPWALQESWFSFRLYLLSFTSANMADHCIPASGYLMRPYSEEHLPCIVSKHGNDQGCQCGSCGKQRDTAPKRFDMLFRILIVFLLRQKRETDAFCTAPPEQIDHKEIEQAQSLAECKEVPKCWQVIV